MIYDAIVIGGGAAGLFCAAVAGRRGKKVLVVEHNAEVGRKILISGGGRCNFTNVHTTAENFVSQNPHFAKSALSRFTPQDFVGLVEKHKIPYYEKKLGQLFCRDSSHNIIEMLVSECRAAGVTIKTSCSVVDVEKGENYTIITNSEKLVARSLVVACGGLSFPKIGATDLGYRIASKFGLAIVETRPSLVALVAAGKKKSGLAGVSIDSDVAVGGERFRENILFTHRGLSGPAILQASNYWKRNEPVRIDLLPDTDVPKMFKDAGGDRRQVGNFLATMLPQRFVSDFLNDAIRSKPLEKLSAAELETLADQLSEWQVTFTDTEGYDRAEVTLGGVSTAELSSKTMEAKRAARLYFIGEVIDVTGWLGGYNFQWAWASGHAAGRAI